MPLAQVYFITTYLRAVVPPGANTILKGKSIGKFSHLLTKQQKNKTMRHLKDFINMQITKQGKTGTHNKDISWIILLHIWPLDIPNLGYKPIQAVLNLLHRSINY